MKTKRLAALVLCLAILMALLPVMQLTAYAEDSTSHEKYSWTVENDRRLHTCSSCEKIYVSNEDGTHTVKRNHICDKLNHYGSCRETKVQTITENERCTFDSSGTCTLCGYQRYQELIGIELNPSKKTLVVGERLRISDITVEPVPSEAPIPVVSWHIIDLYSCVSFEMGEVLALAPGEATLIATVFYPNQSNERGASLSANCVITVVAKSDPVPDNNPVPDKVEPNKGSNTQEEWLKYDGMWYFVNSRGKYQTGWLETAPNRSVRYYFNSKGVMQTGWVKDDGHWYFFTPSGAMRTGWVKDDGHWYYLGGNGAMRTGWLQQGSVWYYLWGSGAMATGTNY